MIALLLLTLSSSLHDLAKSFDGRVGICVQDQRSTTCVNGDQRFSLQSVMKLVTGAAVMDAIDHRGWKLNDPLLVRRADLSLYVQPIAKLVTPEGYRTTVGDLVRRAIVDSDSAATDILIAKLGGPPRVQAFLSRAGISGIRVDRDEKHLQTEIAGLEWRPGFVDPAVIEEAMRRVPDTVKEAAYRRYQHDPRDTATPAGMASFLTALAQGKLLSPASTEHLLDVMTGTVTFPDRLKAGVTGGWSLAHKTGTSSTWQGVTAATNDVGVLMAPDGGRVAIVVFLGDSREPPAKRAALMAAAARLAIAHYR
jgi:beta-lactamase class A